MTSRQPRQRYFNRELSVLDFQGRVLALAENTAVPLLERAKFVAIVAQNLDEFFQVRVAGLKDQILAGAHAISPDGMTAKEQLSAIRVKIDSLNTRMDAVVLDVLLPELERHGISLANWDELDRPDRKQLDDAFDAEIFPVVTPLAVDPAHPFPYISDLSLNLAVLIRDPKGDGDVQFARVKVPPILPRFVALGDDDRFVPLVQVIAAHLERLFPGMEIVGHYPFRVTRNADLSIEEDEAEDLLEAMESEIRRRRRSSRAVRLEAHPTITDEALDLLRRELDLHEEDIYLRHAPLDLAGLWSLAELDHPELRDPPWNPATPARLAKKATDPVDFFGVIRNGDVLVHHPYESFVSSTAGFIAQAAQDPNVLAIKQTLYRTSLPEDPALGGEAAIVRSLVEAAHSGKQVVVLVELKARFDEEANIRWARLLEEAGAHVAYGVVGLKTHSKTALVVRREGNELRRYSHIGTGNYNPKTARIYEDLGFFTADPDIGSDLSELFNVLTGYGHRRKYRKLLVAPTTLRDKLVKMIRAEAKKGAEGRLAFKINHLVDTDMIDVLYEASRAGVQIDLVVRGICSIRPGVPGLSDNIRVRSLVGRYLEHSRIYRFGRPGVDARYFIGSADLMPRNLSWRVEAIVPVEDTTLQGRLEEIISVALADDVLAWELTENGSWRKVAVDAGIESHVRLQELALERSRPVTI